MIYACLILSLTSAFNLKITRKRMSEKKRLLNKKNKILYQNLETLEKHANMLHIYIVIVLNFISQQVLLF